LIAAPERRGEWFRNLLRSTNHVSELVGHIPDTFRIRTGDARTSVRNILWRDRWLSIGDSAWCLDPLSGTGVERSVQSAIAVGAAISEVLNCGKFDPLRSFAVSEAQSFRYSLRLQQLYYETESRWKNEVFWLRRLGR
jgi:flavin-dependent dehydrogenase